MNEAPVRVASDEQAWLEQRRAEIAAEEAARKHQADVKAFAAFATKRANEATKRRDEYRAKVWQAAASEIQNGRWLVERGAGDYPKDTPMSARKSSVLSSDPEIGRFQSLRASLTTSGATTWFAE